MAPVITTSSIVFIIRPFLLLLRKKQAIILSLSNLIKYLCIEAFAEGKFFFGVFCEVPCR
jgi:hypothetical protein